MKILAVCQYYYPEDFQITPICEQLADDGYDGTIWTGNLKKIQEEYTKYLKQKV